MVNSDGNPVWSETIVVDEDPDQGVAGDNTAEQAADGSKGALTAEAGLHDERTKGRRTNSIVTHR